VDRQRNVAYYNRIYAFRGVDNIFVKKKTLYIAFIAICFGSLINGSVVFASAVPPITEYYYSLDFFVDLPADVQFVDIRTPADPDSTWFESQVIGDDSKDRTIVGYSLLSDMDLSWTLFPRCVDYLGGTDLTPPLYNDMYSGFTSGFYPGIISTSAQFHCPVGGFLYLDSDGPVEDGGISAVARVYFVDRDTRIESKTSDITFGLAIIITILSFILIGFVYKNFYGSR